MGLHLQKSRGVSFGGDVSEGYGDEPRLLGVHWSIEDVEYPVPWHLVREIRSEFDPLFVPLFRRRFWQTPNGHAFTDGRFALGRYVPTPESSLPDLGISWPAYRLGGIYFKGPVACALVMDPQDFARAEYESNPDWRGPNGERHWKQIRSEFVPFSGKVVRDMRETRHWLATRRAQDIHRAVTKGAAALRMAKRQAISADRRQALRDDWKRLCRLRQAETEYDRRRAMAPRQPAPWMQMRPA